jgi:flagellar hook-basal body complex protein FliE
MEIRQDIAEVLAQMKQVRETFERDVQAPDIKSFKSPESKNGFGTMIKGALNEVNDIQSESAALKTDYLTGKETDLGRVMVASQKSSVAFQATVQVRNKLVEAYKDIMNMPI